MNVIKKRTWAAILYPDSLPSNWKDLLIDSTVSCAISPLHDKDVNPTGEPKKPHYHLLIYYSGPVTYKHVVDFLEPFNCSIPKPIESVRGYYRYFTHMDNPEKYQYNPVEIECFNGFNGAEFSDLSPALIDSIKFELVSYIFEHNILEYSDLVKAFPFSDFPNEARVISKSTVYLKAIIDSVRYKLDRESRV